MCTLHIKRKIDDLFAHTKAELSTLIDFNFRKWDILTQVYTIYLYIQYKENSLKSIQYTPMQYIGYIVIF